MDETRLERRAPSGNPNGVGALRRFRTGRITSREEVVVFDAPRHFAYVLVSGMPLLDYRADVTLQASEGGTTITWKSQFRPKLWGTGWIYAFMLRRFLARFLQALAAEAEKAVLPAMESVSGRVVA